MDSIRLPACLESLAALRSFLRGKLKRWNLEAGLRERVELALEETLVNIGRYAYPNRAGDVEVFCWLQAGGRLRVEIHDWGIPCNPLERPRPDPSQDLGSRKVGGWGLELMRRMADELSYSYSQGKNILSLTFRPRSSSAPTLPGA